MATSRSQYSGNSNHAIDLPRHLKISSKEPSLRSARVMLREQKFCHSKFEPSLHSCSELHFYKGIYSTNELADPVFEKNINVSDFIRLECPKTMRNQPNHTMLPETKSKTKFSKQKRKIDDP